MDLTTPEQRHRPGRSRWFRGCLATLALSVVAVVVGAVLLFMWLNPTPIRVTTSGSDFEPWPAPLVVIGERRVLGSPEVSSETAPRVERHYLLIRANGQDVDTTAALVAAHLDSLGWKMESEPSGEPWWFSWSTRRTPTREQAYVGPLSAYLSAGSWTADDEGAPRELRRLARGRVPETVVVQIFAAGR